MKPTSSRLLVACWCSLALMHSVAFALDLEQPVGQSITSAANPVGLQAGSDQTSISNGGETANSVPRTISEPFEFGDCAFEWEDMLCKLVGLRGPVKKVFWMDSDLHVEEASVEFNKEGHGTRWCHRGHTDFQGRTCSDTSHFLAKNPSGVVEYDVHSRVLRRKHFKFGNIPFDVCSYDDTPGSRSSECNDGEYIVKHTYDETGRTLTYSRRRIPLDNEAADRSRKLDPYYALDVRYVYIDDLHGNWIEYQMIHIPGVSQNRYSWNPVKRTIEYYR